MKVISWILGVLAGVIIVFTLVESCNEAVCASVVSKCLLTQSCNCGLKNCSCCHECFTCLGDYFTECCSCVDMCPKPENTGNVLSKKSHVEDFQDPVPDLFEALMSEPDTSERWISYVYPVDIDVSMYNPKLEVKIITNNDPVATVSNTVSINCTVAFMSECMSWNKCKSSCRSTGASRYRWFHDACCECIGHTCINYGLNESRIPTDEIPKWYRYFLCAVKGVLEKMEFQEAPGGINAVVSGSILPNSGLSSSSALVCAATLAVSKGYGLTLTKKELAELATKSEKYIGTQGGGMDQAIAFLATEGCAKVISFNPLTATDLKLPEGAVFVIASSLVQMNKAATQDFNSRVVECRLVSQLLSKRLRIDWKKIHRLDSMQKSIGLGVRHLRALATETLHEEPYKKDEICRELQVTQDELNNISLSENTKNIKEFKLKQRMLHVTQEVERVQEFIRVCKECAKGDMSPEAGLYNLGQLMKKSHESLKTLYECSHEELDKIVAIAEKHTLGARLTGAGWGGCTVALTTADKVDDYISALKEEFYTDNPRADDLDLNSLVFQTQPGRGAVIYIKA